MLPGSCLFSFKRYWLFDDNVFLALFCVDVTLVDDLVDVDTFGRWWWSWWCDGTIISFDNIYVTVFLFVKSCLLACSTRNDSEKNGSREQTENGYKYITCVIWTIFKIKYLQVFNVIRLSIMVKASQPLQNIREHDVIEGCILLYLVNHIIPLIQEKPTY